MKTCTYNNMNRSQTTISEGNIQQSISYTMQNKELDNFTRKQPRTYIKHIRLGTSESWEGE